MPLLLLCVMPVGCRQGVTRAEWQTIRLWLECIECEPHHLGAVVALGDAAVPVLRSTLRDLPEDRKRRMEARLLAQWEELHATTAGASGYVNFHLGNLVALVRSRSAAALGALQEWDALRMALDSADAWDYGPQEREAVQRALFTDAAGAPSDGIVRGRVVEQGRPPVAARITVALRRCGDAPTAYSPPREGRCRTYTGTAATTRTDVDGRFSFPGLVEGVYEVAPTPAFTDTSPPSALYLLVGDSAVESRTFELRG